MHRIIYIFVFIISYFISPVLSQNITGSITDISGTPLVGANVVWVHSTIGVVTDLDGRFSISEENIVDRRLGISYIGYKSDTINIGSVLDWKIQLLEQNTMETIVFSADRQSTGFLNTIAKVEVIGTKELERAACCSLAGCFNTEASVQSNTTNVVTDAKELQILGLSGVYNQILFDGMPLIQGAGFSYAAGSFPGPMIEQIFVSKGANSVLQGFESISGQINIITPKPETAKRIYLNAFLNSFGENQYNASYQHKAKSWSNYSLAHLTLPAQTIDGDKDNFKDITQITRINLFNKWIYENPENDNFKTQIGVRLWNEDRLGGQLDFEVEDDKGTENSYGQLIEINQVDLYFKSRFKINENVSINLLNSGFVHNQNSYFGTTNYKADQINGYTDVGANIYYGKNDNNLKFGSSLRYNDLEEHIYSPDTSLSSFANLKNKYTIPGVYVENTYKYDKFSIIAGIRSDYHDDFGWKIVPRMLVRYGFSPRSDLRFSIGKGVRRVHLFGEQTRLLASNRNIIINGTLEPEEAVNIGLNYVHKLSLDFAETSFSMDGYYTFFQNQVFPDFDREVNKVIVENFKGESVSQNFQIENKWEFINNIEVKWAYNYLDVYRNTEEGTRMTLPFISKHWVLLNLSYESNLEKWQYDLTGRWFSKKRLPNTDDYPIEFRQDEYSRDYTIIDAQITRKWDNIQVYFGVENILAFRQNQPIVSYEDPFGPYFDTSFNWGPTRGREFYIGFRYKKD